VIIQTTPEKAGPELTLGSGAAIHLRQFILKVASRCNLNCSYCYMYNLADTTYRNYPTKYMEPSVQIAAFDRIREYVGEAALSQSSVILHGGEPLLLGHQRFAELGEELRGRLGSDVYVTLQTNGTLIDSRWIELFRQYRVHVGVSIDGTKASHNRFRVDHAGRGSYDATLAGLSRLREDLPDLFTGILCVIDIESDPVEVYRHIRSLGILWMDFLLPDATHDAPQPGYGTAPLYGAWLCGVYDEWLREDNPAVRIRSLESIVRALLGFRGITDTFGGNPLGYVVVETDGRFGAVDSLRAVQEGLTQTNMDVLRHGFADLSRASIIRDMQSGRNGLSETCLACTYSKECGGGYFPHRYRRDTRFKNPSVYCWDLFHLFSHISRTLGERSVQNTV
jgi:uncharacterized protein